jgi:hypothetical protein
MHLGAAHPFDADAGLHPVKRFHSSDIPGFPGPLGVIFRIHQGGAQRNSTAAIAHGNGDDPHALEKTHFPR